MLVKEIVFLSEWNPELKGIETAQHDQFAPRIESEWNPELKGIETLKAPCLASARDLNGTLN